MLEFLILIIVPLAAAGVWNFVRDIKIQYAGSVLIAAMHLGVSLLLFLGYDHPVLPTYFSIDALSRFFLLILSNVYFWIVLVSYSYLRRPALPRAEGGKRYYFLLLNVYLSANTAAMISSHFGMFWVAIEATTLSVAPLIYFYRNEEALEAMWKYLFIVSVGIAFAFVGILFLTLAAKGTAIEGKQLFYWESIRHAVSLNPIWLKASFIFILVGLSTKIGIAPMHSGDVDATSNAPSPIAALMSGSLRLTAFMGVLRILEIVRPTPVYEFARTLLIIGGVASLFAAFVYTFRITNYKRMLAYSSVEHLGLISLGAGIGGLAFAGALYHALYNSMSKIVIFLSAGNIHRFYGSRETERVRSVLRILPITGWLFLIGYLAISGIPPFGIFFSELKIFEGILDSRSPFLLPIAMALILFIVVNMGRSVFGMLYGKPDSEHHEIKQERLELTHVVTILVLVLLTVISAFTPAIVQSNILAIMKDFGVAG